MCVFEFQMSVVNWFGLTCAGTVLYTFLEYIFHRVVLHSYLPKIHGNHHRQPRNLRIIATPILPVQLYDFFVVLGIMLVLGQPIAYGINCGIALGQCIMDVVHIVFHSKMRPWYLESARSYHTVHHFKDDNVAHGLTCAFWDMVFGTLPPDWTYYEKHPLARYLQFPLPLVSFALLSLLANDKTKYMTESVYVKEKMEKEILAAPTEQVRIRLTRKRDNREFGIPHSSMLISSFCTAMLVVIGWQTSAAAVC